MSQYIAYCDRESVTSLHKLFILSIDCVTTMRTLTKRVDCTGTPHILAYDVAGLGDKVLFGTVLSQHLSILPLSLEGGGGLRDNADKSKQPSDGYEKKGWLDRLSPWSKASRLRMIIMRKQLTMVCHW